MRFLRRTEVQVQEDTVEEVRELVEVPGAVHDALGPQAIEDAEHQRRDADHHGGDGEQSTDDEGEHARAGRTALYGSGSVSLNTLPPPGLGSVQRRPPWRSSVRREMARPSPVP